MEKKKSNYFKPELKEHGKLEEITKGGGDFPTEPGEGS